MSNIQSAAFTPAFERHLNGRAYFSESSWLAAKTAFEARTAASEAWKQSSTGTPEAYERTRAALMNDKAEHLVVTAGADRPEHNGTVRMTPLPSGFGPTMYSVAANPPLVKA